MFDLFHMAWTTHKAELCNLIGFGGFLTYVGNYSLLSLQKIGVDTIWYFVINTMAACMVLIGLSQNFNLSSALIQCFWIVVGVCAILKRLAAARARMVRGL